MQPLWETCRPRQEVLGGLLTESLFAAELTPVVEQQAPAVYAEPEAFFANTYPTEGLRSLLSEVFRRLCGQGGNPLLRLETSMGGGKTHGLIALYHAARSSAQAPEELLPAELRPDQPVRWAAVVGKDFGVGGREHGDLHAHTLWGEMAWQLGGAEGYRLVAESDRQGIAPGGDAWRALLGAGPNLLMIDEIGTYLRAAQGRKLAGQGTLADQVPAFLGALVSTVSSLPRSVLVLTLTGAQDAFAEENEELRRALKEVQGIGARQELILRPTRDDEVAPVVVRRLFEQVDREAATESARVYSDYYEQSERRQNAELPARALRPDYRGELERTYPFHPEFLRLLTEKVAAVPDFQRTRGALRLLARVVRSVWQQQAEDAWLIHPHHLDFADEETRGDLTYRLGQDRGDLQPVIQADIYDPQGAAHAQEQDRDWQARGKPPLAGRLAKAVYLHSLPLGKAGRAPLADLVLACAQPGLDPDLLREALGRLVGDGGCWYLHADENSFWFNTEVTLNRILYEVREQITTAQAKEEARKRLRSIYDGSGLQLVAFPENPVEVDDTGEKLKLCLLDFDYVATRTAEAVPPAVALLQERSGSQQTFRQNKNVLLFLLADTDQIPSLVQAGRDLLALRHIVNTADLLSKLSESNQAEARKRQSTAELELRVALTRAYRHLLVPDPESTADPSGLRQISLDVEKASKLERDRKAGGSGQQAVLTDALVEAGKLMPPDQAPAAELVQQIAWPHGQESMTGRELVNVFRQRPRLPMLRDPHPLRRTILRGIEQQLWVYYGGRRVWTWQAREPLQEADVRLDSEHELWLPPVVAHRGYCAVCGSQPCACAPPRPQVCRRCGRPLGECSCEVSPVPEFEAGQVPPAPAFQQLRDWAQDHHLALLEQIQVTCFDRPADLQQLWIGMTSLAPLPRLQVVFEGSVELPVLRSPGAQAQMTRDQVELRYQGHGEGFRRIYEFFTGLTAALTDGGGAVGFTAQIAAELAQPLAPGAGELDGLRRRLVDSQVPQVTLRARAVPPSP